MQPSQNKQEFFTLDTRITIQRGNIYHNRIKYDTDAGHDRFVAFGALVLFTAYLIYLVVEEREYSWIFSDFANAYMALAPLQKNLPNPFVKTWRSIIPLKDVKNITTKPLDNGLETEVILHLSSGRKKFYTFRNAEGQMESFIAAVSAQAAVSSPVALQ